MKDYIILVDSTADLGKDLREKYNIEYVQMNINFDGKELPATLDWDLYTAKELYDVMRKGTRIMTTQVPVTAYEEVFTDCAKNGKGVLYISCSSALSGSVNTAYTVKQTVLEEYPDAQIEIVDSKISCLGQGILAIKAAKMRNEGKPIEEVAKFIEDNKLKVHQFATVESLEYLKRAGRVKSSSAFFGNIFSVKPIIISDVKGNNYAYRKVKGRRTSLLELCEEVKKNIVDPENQTICIGHADSYDDALFIKEHLEKEIKCAGFYINFIGPIVGASVGPGTIGVYFIGNEVTICGE